MHLKSLEQDARDSQDIVYCCMVIILLGFTTLLSIIYVKLSISPFHIIAWNIPIQVLPSSMYLLSSYKGLVSSRQMEKIEIIYLDYNAVLLMKYQFSVISRHMEKMETKDKCWNTLVLRLLFGEETIKLELWKRKIAESLVYNWKIGDKIRVKRIWRFFLQ